MLPPPPYTWLITTFFELPQPSTGDAMVSKPLTSADASAARPLTPVIAPVVRNRYRLPGLSAVAKLRVTKVWVTSRDTVPPTQLALLPSTVTCTEPVHAPLAACIVSDAAVTGWLSRNEIWLGAGYCIVPSGGFTPTTTGDVAMSPVVHAARSASPSVRHIGLAVMLNFMPLCQWRAVATASGTRSWKLALVAVTPAVVT